tara:strand:- start:413 stop:775 length:363 start_codon:yes stop_codon:yes gene_type:complete
MKDNFLEIENIKIWARVGVLPKEREFGQIFSLNITLWADFDECTQNDDINSTIDYSILINLLKTHAKDFSCKTIEKYSHEISQLIFKRFKPQRLKVSLTKCNPPIIGFNGQVSITRTYES